MVPTDGSLLIIANITSSVARSSYANIKIPGTGYCTAYEIISFQERNYYYYCRGGLTSGYPLSYVFSGLSGCDRIH
jgi:hypothetical protein